LIPVVEPPFEAVANLLIPSGDGMPSATEAGVAGRWLDEVAATEA